ncbi:hypothetical protein Scep_005106 [Stephania cephalantha]|uniref:Uncharacterized protein n=1 Tax=Stephania cephalantha TaxID=152367 RepID=A0AAP0KTN5_9MAGN
MRTIPGIKHPGSPWLTLIIKGLLEELSPSLVTIAGPLSSKGNEPVLEIWNCRLDSLLTLNPDISYGWKYLNESNDKFGSVESYEGPKGSR